VKNKSIGSLILLAILAPACGGGGGGGGSKHPVTAPRWTEQFRFPTSSDLRAVIFGDPNHGIAAGKNGTFVRTDDGGNTWRTLEFTPASLVGDVLAICAGNITTIAVGATPAGNSIAWGSADANTFVTPDPTITSQPEPWVDVAMAVPSTNPQTAGTFRLRPSGWVDPYQGGALAPIDSRINDQSGGVVAPTPWTKAYGISTVGASGVFAVCGDNGGAGQIRVTTNSGMFFTTQTLPGSPSPFPILRRISLLDTTHGFAVGDANTGVYTTNMTSWTALPLPGIAAGTLRGLSFVNSTLGWAVGDGGRIFKYTFAGTWSVAVQASNTTQDLYDVWFTDASNGYAVGNSGTVVKTTNGGANWTVMSGPANANTTVFRAVDFTAGGSVGLVVGDAAGAGAPATLLRSVDAGLTWTSFNASIPLGTNLTAVSIPRTGSNTVAFVGTAAGDVYFNTDLLGTGAWTKAGGTSLGTPIKAMLFPMGDITGFVSGAGGKCARVDFTAAVGAPPTPASATINAPMALPGTPAGTLYALACNPTGTLVYVAGDAGYVASTPDSGANWTAVATLTGHSIRALQAPTGANFTLFAGADDGMVYHLSAGGAPAWAATSLPGLASPASVGTPASMAFINDMQGWVVVQGTSVGLVYTIDGGATWFVSVPHVPLDGTAATYLNDIWMHSAGALGVIVGANGVILRTTTGGQ
jgi:photosystem II stability/assembly factor-like uncharacterized protein